MKYHLTYGLRPICEHRHFAKDLITIAGGCMFDSRAKAEKARQKFFGPLKQYASIEIKIKKGKCLCEERLKHKIKEAKELLKREGILK